MEYDRGVIVNSGEKEEASFVTDVRGEMIPMKGVLDAHGIAFVKAGKTHDDPAPEDLRRLKSCRHLVSEHS